MLIRNIILSAGLSTLVVAAPTPELPTVDFGYGVYRATYYNETYDAFVFSNIRYAAPPVGALRFGAPQPPLPDRSKIHDGSEGFLCPQAIVSYLPLPLSPGIESEDCLFLDVIVPRKVLSGGVGKVPVLFWIYGGAYSFGSKTMQGDAITLLKESASPVVWVAVSYRGGHFGFLGGPTFTLSEGTIPNAGLYDQRFALQWVQDNIHHFNGEKDEVTIMGNSAGGGSVIHHITAFGGEGPTLFKQAIPMGGAFYPLGGHETAEEEYTVFEALVGCAGKGVGCLRAVPEADMIKASRAYYSTLQAPRIGLGVVIDGNLVPDFPPYLVAQGRFHKSIAILVSNDDNEGSFFVSDSNPLPIDQQVDTVFPTSSASVLSTLMSFYPPPGATTPYKTELTRLSKIVADTLFNAHRYILSTALPDRTFNVVFAGVHNTGVNHLFNNIADVYSAQIATGMRRFVMNFVVGGNPNGVEGSVGDGVKWPVFGAAGTGLSIDGPTMKLADAAVDKDIYNWLVKGLELA